MRSDLNSQNEDQNNNQHDPEGDHHDHGRFNMSVLGNPNNLPTITEGDYTLSPFFTGPLTITNLSGGVFTVYGDYQDINFVLTGNTYSTSGTFNDLINNVSITLGGNHIILGNGVNTIYGTLRDINMSDTGGTALGLGTTGVTVNTLIENTNIDLTGGGVGNTITAGNGVNTVYGDMRNYTITVGGATAISDPSFNTSPNTQAITEILNLNFTVGDNHITLGNGTNTVFGDMRSLNMNSGPANADGFNALAVTDYANPQYGILTTDLGSTRPPVPAIIPNNYHFNSDVITVGNGVNVIYGHLQNLNVALTSGSSTSPGTFATTPGSGYDPSSFFSINNVPYSDPSLMWVAGSVAQNTIAFENIIMNANTITAGSGVNTIFGDFQTLQMSFVAGTSTGTFPGTPFSGLNTLDFTVPFNNTRFSTNLIAMDGNTIQAGLNSSSTNTIYGTGQDFIVNATGGVNNQGMQMHTGLIFDVIVMGGTGTYDFTAQTFTTTVTGNTIHTGNGVNTIFGDMRDFISNTIGGTQNGENTLSLSFPNEGPGVNNSELDMGFNHISIGNGVNVIYGSMRDISVSNSGGIIENIPSGGTDEEFNDFFVRNTISMGHDVITAGLTGSSNNTIYGDMRDLTFSGTGGTGINIALDSLVLTDADIGRNILNMGSNSITSGSGVNTIYGDLHDLTLSAVGGSNSSSAAFGAGGGGVFIFFDRFFMGNNSITAGMAGSSVNTVYGEGHNFSFSVVGGVASEGQCAFNQILFDRFFMGNNTITTGDGTSIVYGDVQSLSWSIKGGTADGLGSYAQGQDLNDRVVMGGNTITVGNGNDTLYGNAQSLSLSVQGGTVTNGGDLFIPSLGVTNLTDASAHMINASITMNGNHLYGGAGMDTLYAHVRDLTFTATAGTVTSGTGDVSASFSGDINYTDGNANGNNPDTGSTIIFGGSTLDGGAGNDTLIGSDALNLSGLGNFLKGLNTIQWGDNTLTGGTGADKFEFSLASLHPNNPSDTHLENQGHATITDFSTSQGDKLVFKVAAGVTLAQINADTVFDTSHNVGGGAANDTVATFHDGSSITLYDVNIAAFSAANTVLVH